MLDELGVSVERIVVTELRDGTFFAELAPAPAGERPHAVSSRPSDAIALAVRIGSPIFADEAVLDEAGREPEERGRRGAAEEVVEQFREFIDQVNPEDFAS